MPANFNPENYHRLCEELADVDDDFKLILDVYGYPPLWTRENNIESLVHIILEQQVSLASARAALNKLKEKMGEMSTEKILSLSDEEMKSCYVSRQKAGYLRNLAVTIEKGDLNLKSFELMSDEEIRENLIQLKGIGNWTIDVYLMFTLQRVDIFPIGDLAVLNAIKRLKNLTSSSREEILEISNRWKPLRSIASMMLWHYYLSNFKKKK